MPKYHPVRTSLSKVGQSLNTSRLHVKGLHSNLKDGMRTIHTQSIQNLHPNVYFSSFESLCRCILPELMNNFAKTLVLVGDHEPLRGGMSAPQNLQGTVWLLLLAGTT
jgi:hypothetical protein